PVRVSLVGERNDLRALALRLRQETERGQRELQEPDGTGLPHLQPKREAASFCGLEFIRQTLRAFGNLVLSRPILLALRKSSPCEQPDPARVAFILSLDPEV